MQHIISVISGHIIARHHKKRNLPAVESALPNGRIRSASF
ncbi:hypothetical protein BRYFOR_05298 [Marvinbryantia formatexigens DSM 14469]|uniref:Uncharacterized protein n=1 Tax=Marvinbryantia formatexigens DSM 14469 TaxID=478749 RepID=C6L9K7_9FIRM|nr:hypothetical protein BRYFOR_05298 [Marvinbryantia formatexigens DSM 14469]